jgi:hypothetical protein
MGGKKREDVEGDEDIPKITDAEITEDGAILIKFDRFPMKAKKKVLFYPEALFAIAQEYAEIETEGDFAGYPAVYEEAIFPDEEEIENPLDQEQDAEPEGEVEPPSVLDGPEEDDEDDEDKEK